VSFNFINFFILAHNLKALVKANGGTAPGRNKNIEPCQKILIPQKKTGKTVAYSLT
jgi:hypothetical protein